MKYIPNWIRRLFYPKHRDELQCEPLNMFFEGVRVLPDLPKNMPNLETLIKEFETGFNSMSINRQDATGLSVASGGNFVRKIVQAYESSARASTENAQYEQNRKRYGFSNTLETIWNRKNVEKNDSRSAMNGGSSSSPRCWKNFKEKLKMSSAPFIIKAHNIENFVMPNRCMESNEKTILKTRPEVFSSSSRTSETSSPKKKCQIFRNLSKNDDVNKPKNKESIICSSPLEDVEDKDKNCGDVLEILTNSCDSNSTGNSSYRNLRVNLYDFEDEGWHLSLSSSSSISSRFSCDDTPSSTDYNLDSFFEDTTVISENEDVSNNRENPRKFIPIPSSGSNWKSPRVIGASLKRPIKIDDDTCVTWIPALGEQLPRERSLKKLLSEFSAKLSLNYRKIGRKLRERPKKQEHTPDSGFVELFPSSLSSSSSRSWHSDPGIDKESTSPTFRTFGRAKSTREYHASERTDKNPRIVLTDVPREKFAANCEPAEPSPWVLSRHTPSPCRGNRQNVDSSSCNAIIASSPKSKISCRHSLLLKHPDLNQNGIPKHPSVAQTVGQIEEKEAIMKKNLTCDMMVEQKFDVRKFESPAIPLISVPVPEPALNISYPRMSEWIDSSLSSTGSRLYKSTSALDNVVLHRQAPIFNVPGRLSNLTAKSSSVIYCVPRMQRKQLRYATVSPKNLRFSMSREKSRAIEMSFDA